MVAITPVRAEDRAEWLDLNLARKTVTLGPSVTRIPHDGLTIHEAGKTETSNRTIVVPDATMLS